MYGGDYAVFLRQPNGIEFEIGPFTVLGASAPPPFIEPDLGPPGTTFTIVDELARIEDGDLAVFYAEGTDPNTQGVVAQATISPDGTSLTGIVPGSAAQGVQNFVSVRPSGGPSRFGDLAFFVTGTPQPTVAPQSGPVGVRFTITDPQARMAPTDVCLFYPDGAAPEAGTPVTDVVITPNSATGTVPTSLAPGEYLITVRPTLAEPGRFADLPFDVDL
jgi:hypothetical protein